MARKKKDIDEIQVVEMTKENEKEENHGNTYIGDEWYEYYGELENDLDIDNLSFSKIPSKKRKRYKDNEVVSDIGIFDGAEKEFLSEEDIKFRDWNILGEYAARGTVLEGTICAIEPNKATKTLLIITKYFSFDRIVIPESEFFYEHSFKGDYELQTEEEKFRRRYQMLRGMVGGRISFIIAGLERKEKPDGSFEHYIVASRLMAARKKREHFFFGPNGPIIKVGSIVEARVMSLNRAWAKVDLYGIETAINIRHLSMNSWIKDVSRSFVIGQKIIAQVMKLEISNETKEVKIMLSRREMGGSALIENARKMKVGTVAMGEIIHYSSEKNVATAVLHGDVLASIPKIRMIGDEVFLPGDLVCVVVIDTRYDKGYVIGNATRVRSKYNSPNG